MSVLNSPFVRARMKPRMGRRLVGLFASVFVMGMCVAAFSISGVGTDPCSCMNLGISGKLGISFGTWQMLFNAALLLIVIRFSPEMISIGTLANMILVGYVAEFFMGVFGALVPEQGLTLIQRAMIFVPAMAMFLAVASIYMTVDLGFAPYDAVPVILGARAKRLSPRAVRVIWDVCALSIGFALGSTVGIATLIIGFCLGPASAAARERLRGGCE